METAKNYFLEEALTADARKNISSDFHWTEDTLDKCKDKLSWKKVCQIDKIFWTPKMLEKFKLYIDWDALSDSGNESILREDILEKYKDKWNWRSLSSCILSTNNLNLVDKFIDYLDWGSLVNGWQNSDCLNYAFYEKYQQYIPDSALKKSHLWNSLVEKREMDLMIEYLS